MVLGNPVVVVHIAHLLTIFESKVLQLQLGYEVP